MQYRRLGRTGLQVSLLGVGGGYLAQLERCVGEHIYQRAFELGINYFDGRYGDSSLKLRPLLKQHRERCVVVSKTRETGAIGFMRRVEEDLRDCGTDYLDGFFLRTYSLEMLHDHLSPGGAFEGALKARGQGKIRFIGMATHGDLAVLEAGIKTGLVDAAIFPFNIVRREALQSLIPLAAQYDVGLIVMKPLSTGVIPAEIGLPWLANQPIHTMVPGISSLEQLELDARILDREPMTLDMVEEAAVEDWRIKLEHQVCRICDDTVRCCPENLSVSMLVHHDVWYNHYRNMGIDKFLTYPWAEGARKTMEAHFRQRLAVLQRCTLCHKCEQRCPYGLPVVEMVEEMLQDHPPLIAALEARGWAQSESENWSM
ncbi:MAG: aldo/keto reductase [Chloroflexi bacterium]|nr:aldo/keto reductase [Chloroflexota bacterium]